MSSSLVKFLSGPRSGGPFHASAGSSALDLCFSARAARSSSTERMGRLAAPFRSVFLGGADASSSVGASIAFDPLNRKYHPLRKEHGLPKFFYLDLLSSYIAPWGFPTDSRVSSDKSRAVIFDYIVGVWRGHHVVAITKYIIT
jgi:hypothetical protein